MPHGEALKCVDWGGETEYLLDMLNVLAMPFTFSIPTGIEICVPACAGMKTLDGHPRARHGLVWLLSAPDVLEISGLMSKRLRS